MSNDELFAAVRAWAARNYPGSRVVSVTLQFNDVGEARLPLPLGSPSAPPAAAEDWQPSDNQLLILDVLEGKALKADALASQSGVDRRQLFRELPELRQRGLVQHHQRLGYYRPDTPPEPLEGQPRPGR